MDELVHYIQVKTICLNCCSSSHNPNKHSPKQKARKEVGGCLDYMALLPCTLHQSDTPLASYKTG